MNAQPNTILFNGNALGNRQVSGAISLSSERCFGLSTWHNEYKSNDVIGDMRTIETPRSLQKQDTNL